MLQRRLIVLLMLVVAPAIGVVAYTMMVKWHMPPTQVFVVVLAVSAVLVSVSVFVVHKKFRAGIKRVCEELGLDFKGTGIGIIAQGTYQNIPVVVERKSTLSVSYASDAAGTIPERILINAGQTSDKSPVRASFFRRKPGGSDFNSIFIIRNEIQIPELIKRQVVQFVIPHLIEVEVKDESVMTMLKGLPTKRQEWINILSLTTFLFERRAQL